MNSMCVKGALHLCRKRSTVCTHVCMYAWWTQTRIEYCIMYSFMLILSLQASSKCVHVLVSHAYVCAQGCVLFDYAKNKIKIDVNAGGGWGELERPLLKRVYAIISLAWVVSSHGNMLASATPQHGYIYMWGHHQHVATFMLRLCGVYTVT
jgi:hypothetical protein